MPYGDDGLLFSRDGLPHVVSTLDKSTTGDFQVEVASADDKILAYSTIAPTLMPGRLPDTRFVDVVTEVALQKAAAATALEYPSGNDLLAAQEVIFQLQGKHKPRVLADTFALQTMPAQRSSSTYEQLQYVQPLLATDRLSRPHWQDMSVDAQFKPEKNSGRFVVLIDPGHGGSDPGSIGHNGLLEKGLTLDIAQRVRLFLTEFEDVEVQLTRNHDHGLSRMTRVAAIERSGADVVISLHFNQLPQSDVNLVESFYAGSNRTGQQPTNGSVNGATRVHDTQFNEQLEHSLAINSKRLAQALQQHVVAEVGFDNDKVVDAGVKQRGLFVLSESPTPTVLMEISCLSYAPEAQRLKSEAYRDRLAAALVDGIRSYRDALANPSPHAPI